MSLADDLRLEGPTIIMALSKVVFKSCLVFFKFPANAAFSCSCYLLPLATPWLCELYHNSKIKA